MLCRNHDNVTCYLIGTALGKDERVQGLRNKLASIVQHLDRVGEEVKEDKENTRQDDNTFDLGNNSKF